MGGDVPGTAKLWSIPWTCRKDTGTSFWLLLLLQVLYTIGILVFLSPKRLTASYPFLSLKSEWGLAGDSAYLSSRKIFFFLYFYSLHVPQSGLIISYRQSSHWWCRPFLVSHFVTDIPFPHFLSKLNEKFRSVFKQMKSIINVSEIIGETFKDNLWMCALIVSFLEFFYLWVSCFLIKIYGLHLKKCSSALMVISALRTEYVNW